MEPHDTETSGKLELTGILENGYGIIPKKIMQAPDLTIYEKAILAYMLSFTGGGAVCFPSYKKMCEDLQISKPTLSKALKNLCAKGYILKEKLYPNDPLKHHNKYTLVFLYEPTFVNEINSRSTNGLPSRVAKLTSNNNINNNNIKDNNKKLKKSGTGKVPVPLGDFTTPQGGGGSQEEKESKKNLIYTENQKIDPPLDRTNWCAKIEDLCKLSFSNHSQMVEFLYGIDFKQNFKNLYKFVGDIIQLYPPAEVETYVQIFIKTKPEKYNITFVKEAFRRINMNQEPKKHETNKFKKICVEYFGEKDGEVVANFYAYILKAVGDKGNTEKNGTARKMKNITNMVEKHGKDLVLKCVNQLTEDYNAGIIKDQSLRYFTNYINKIASGKSFTQQGTRPTALYPVTEVKDVIPVPYKRETNPKRLETDPKMEKANWFYKCTCGGVVDISHTFCPHCKSYFVWRDVHVPERPSREGAMDTIQSE